MNSPIPERKLTSAGGEIVYNTEVNETLHPEAAPENVPMDVWRATVALAQAESTAPAYHVGAESPTSSTRATLQVLELVRIPYTQSQLSLWKPGLHLLCLRCDGQEKFYADRYPARWDRIERLVKAITNDLMTPAQQEPIAPSQPTPGYRVPIEVPPYTVTEDEENN